MNTKTETFIKKANLKHNNKYNYSKVIYINNKQKISITCPIHDEFIQTPNDHLNGCGCPICGSNKLNNLKFIEKAKDIHDNKYDYSKVEYVHSKSKIIIVCKTHGDFIQKPNHHLNGAGCPICKESRGEREIKKHLNNNKIIFIHQKRFQDCKDKKQLPFDFYLPDYNICIEFHGQQHYKAISYWGGNKNFEKQQKRDNIKKMYCINNNLKLIIINNIKLITKNLIFN